MRFKRGLRTHGKTKLDPHECSTCAFGRVSPWFRLHGSNGSWIWIAPVVDGSRIRFWRYVRGSAGFFDSFGGTLDGLPVWQC